MLTLSHTFFVTMFIKHRTKKEYTEIENVVKVPLIHENIIVFLFKGLSRSVKRGTMDELELDYMSDGLPYLTLAYTNGLGYNYHRTEGKKPVAIRRNLTQDEADGILCKF